MVSSLVKGTNNDVPSWDLDYLWAPHSGLSKNHRIPQGAGRLPPAQDLVVGGFSAPRCLRFTGSFVGVLGCAAKKVCYL